MRKSNLRGSHGSWVVWLAAAWSGCLSGPPDDSTVASTSAAVTFAGAYPEPSHAVTIEQLDLQQGIWEPRAKTFASDTASQDAAGNPWYVWIVEGTLDPSPRFWQWTAEPKLELATTLRGRSTTGFQYATFRSDDATRACIDANRARGGYEVFVNCATGNTLRLRYQVPLRGPTDCPYGSHDCNACVSNVAQAFQRIARTPAAKVRYRSHGGRRLPPYDAALASFGSDEAHVQGIARLPGFGADTDPAGLGPWFVLTRSTPGQVGAAGMFLVNLSDLPTRGGAALKQNAGGEPAAGRETRFYYPIAGIDHPGGLQTLGHFVFIASDCDRDAACGSATYVDIFDLSTLGNPYAYVQRFKLGEQGEPGNVSTITSVAVTRLQTGHVLLFVLGKDINHEGWFYVSDRTTISGETRWLYRGAWTGPLGGREEYQSTTFVTECETGDLYLLGSGNGKFDAGTVLVGDALGTAPGTDSMSLLRLAGSETGGVAMEVVGSRTFDPGGDGFCTFRAASSVHATPAHDLVVYCSARKAQTDLLGMPDSKLKLSEFAAP